MTATTRQLDLWDTGQKPTSNTDDVLAFGVPVSIAHKADEADRFRLGIVQHDIHRLDATTDDATENVMSTLRYFILRIGVFDGDGVTPTATKDGLRLKASLVYEHGSQVEELSATLEPPLLGGETIVDNGIAAFKLRITVLSSLCRGNRFRVQVTCADGPELNILTAPMRTITKLRRPPNKKAAAKAAAAAAESTSGSPLLGAGLKRGLELESFLLDDFEAYGLTPDDASGRTFDELWNEVQENGSLLHTLQNQQRELFRELRELRDLRQKLADAN